MGFGNAACFNAFAIPGGRKEGEIAAKEDLFLKAQGAGPSVDPCIVQENRSGRVIIQVSVFFPLFRHSFVEQQASSPVGKNDGEVRVVFDEPIQRLQGGIGFPRVVMPHRFVGVYQHRQPPFQTGSGKTPGICSFVDTETLPCGEELPYASQSTITLLPR